MAWHDVMKALKEQKIQIHFTCVLDTEICLIVPKGVPKRKC